MRRWSTIAMVALIGACFCLGSAEGHSKAPPQREILHIQGTVHTVDRPCPGDRATLRVLGRAVRFCSRDVRRIAVASTAVSEPRPLPAELTLQGNRAVIAPLRGAEPGERVTILADWRPGRSDLFVIALDVCSCTERLGQPSESR